MSTANELRLQSYLDAEQKILRGQSVRFENRQVTRADLGEIRRGIATLQKLVNAEKEKAAGRRPGVLLARFDA